MNCAACGRANLPGARFCAQCGSALPASAATEAVPPLPTAPAAPAAPTPAQRPLGVAIFAVLYLLSAGFVALAALAFIFLGLFLGSVAPFSGGSNALLAGPVLAVLGVVTLLFAAFFWFVGLGLWRGRGWTWTVVVVLTAVGALFNVIYLFTGDALLVLSGVVGLAFGALVLWYFTRPGVKRWFGKEAPAPAPALAYVPPPAPPP